MSACHGCGAELAPNRAPGPQRKWCSERCRKRQYAGTCVDCGGPTNGYNGPGQAGERCATCRHAHEHEARYWTPEAVVGAIRCWADEHGGIPPAASVWQALAPVGYPPVSIVQREFGFWNAAVAAAGYSPRSPNTYGRDGEDMNLCREIRARYEAGESLQLLAAEYGCTGKTIGSRVVKAGGTRRSRSEARRLALEHSRTAAA